MQDDNLTLTSCWYPEYSLERQLIAIFNKSRSTKKGNSRPRRFLWNLPMKSRLDIHFIITPSYSSTNAILQKMSVQVEMPGARHMRKVSKYKKKTQSFSRTSIHLVNAIQSNRPFNFMVRFSYLTNYSFI